MRIATLAMVAVLTCSAIGVNADAQTVSEEKQAVLVLDINMEKIKQSKLAKTLGMEAQLGKVAASSSKDSPDPAKLSRFVMAMTAPASVAEAEQFSKGKIPGEFYGRMQFADAASASESFAKMQAEGTAVEMNGKTFYRPNPESKQPEGVLAHQVDDTTIEVATEGYATLPNRDVMTAGLQAAWKTTGDDAIRIAIDVEGASGLIAEAVEMAKTRAKGSAGEAQTTAFLGLIDNMKNLRLGIDFSSDHLIKIEATGVDEKEAQELQGGLDALLGMGKMMGGMQLGGLAQQDPEAAAVASEILQSLNANREGAEVNITIVHPAGLQALAEKFAPMLGVTPTAPRQLAPAE